jgi:hypothetical protein
LLPESKSGPNRNLEIEFQWSNKWWQSIYRIRWPCVSWYIYKVKSLWFLVSSSAKCYRVCASV